MKYTNEELIKFIVLGEYQEERLEAMIKYYNQMMEEELRKKIGKALPEPRKNARGIQEHFYSWTLLKEDLKSASLSSKMGVDAIREKVAQEIYADMTTRGKLESVYRACGEENRGRVDEFFARSTSLIPVTSLEYSPEEQLELMVQSGEVFHMAVSDTEYTAPHHAYIIDLPGGEKGIATAIIQPHYYEEESLAKKGESQRFRIYKMDGTVVGTIAEPELADEPSAQLSMACDGECVYVGSYNTNHSFIACYGPDMQRRWKVDCHGNLVGGEQSQTDIVPMGQEDSKSMSIQSLTTNEQYLIAFDMENGRIMYFDKKTGVRVPEKDIDVKERWGHSHHELSASDEMLLAATPGFDLGFMGLGSLDNMLKLFDSEGKLVSKKGIPIQLGSIEAVATDLDTGMGYLALDNHIIIFSREGYGGSITMPGRVFGLSTSDGNLMVCSKEEDKGGRIDVLSPEARERLTYLPSREVSHFAELAGRTRRAEDLLIESEGLAKPVPTPEPGAKPNKGQTGRGDE